jgi:hypothetical protein
MPCYLLLVADLIAKVECGSLLSSGDSHFHEGRPLAVQTLTTTLHLPHSQYILCYFKVSDHKSCNYSICKHVAAATIEAQISPFIISTSKACIIVVRRHTCRKTPVSSHQPHLPQNG